MDKFWVHFGAHFGIQKWTKHDTKTGIRSVQGGGEASPRGQARASKNQKKAFSVKVRKFRQSHAKLHFLTFGDPKKQNLTQLIILHVESLLY